ncbi:MAG TPA: hypothetical protein PLJ69_10075 [Methanothrix sp.]|nr:MAG: hypothetical protein A4E50_01237 [Methanosaeta sp. PtaB.Bin087]HNR57390.1 hypothetical protein [Methanothrix sp.]HOI69482.1 hypothetical protein [Methanothrix sp.]HPY73585.1 hypothetical protein [Methanothrix sp.]HQA63275.1 hypothetical protein [Methanothrix sp.]
MKQIGKVRSEIVRPLAAVSILLIAVSSLGMGQTISASPSVANPWDEIAVSYSGAPGFDSDWMAIYRVDSANEEYGEWYFLNGNKSGTLTFTAPNEVGSYEFRMFENWAGGGGYSDIAKSNVVRVQLEPVNPIAITASPRLVAPGDLIGVTYSGAPGFDSDWIAIYRAGAANDSYGEWYWLNGNMSGSLTFTAPDEAGSYEFRMFRNWAGGGGYNDIARSNRILVNTSMALGCSWESFTPDQTAFAGQPGDVFPLRENDFVAGSYLVLVGPAGDDGLDLPPATWIAFGPYDLKGGHKYKASIESPEGKFLRFEEDSADLLSYSSPQAGFARVYARNDCAGDTWYAICLQLIKVAGGGGSVGGYPDPCEEDPASLECILFG